MQTKAEPVRSHIQKTERTLKFRQRDALLLHIDDNVGAVGLGWLVGWFRRTRGLDARLTNVLRRLHPTLRI